MWLVQVDVPWACFGFEVTDDGWVIAAAPIAAWTIGKRGRAVVHHYRSRGALVSWQRVPHRLSYAGHPLTGTTEELHAAVDQLDADTVPWSYYQKVLASRAGHGRGTQPQSGAVANGHERSSSAQVARQIA
jgi:hypothetical protein